MKRAERRRGGPATRAEADRRRVILYATFSLIGLVVIIAIAVAARAPKTASDAPTLAQIKVGQDAPAFSISTTAGLVKVPTGDGKPVVLEVFATWCPHCQRETSILNNLYSKYGSRVHIVAVSGSQYGMDENSPETQADVVKFSQRFKTHYPVAFDSERDVAGKYLQGGFPTIVSIDRAGKIVNVRDGEVSEATLVKDVESMLKG